jgi:hypothetical protein
MRPLYVIAQEIDTYWANPYFGAVPYIKAMGRLDKITDMYGVETGDSIVRRFLVNSRPWKGHIARRIKMELKEMIGP